MSDDYPAKTFKSGNSLALRLPKALGLKEGMTMRVRQERGRFIVTPTPSRDEIDLSEIFGTVPGISRPPCDDNPRDWHAAIRHA